MSILFLYNEAINPKVGGVEKITYLLANYFELKGFKVYFISGFNKYPTNDIRQFFLPDISSFNTQKNIDFLIKFIQENNIKIVINQGGTNPEISKLAFNASTAGAKLITVIHNSLLANIIHYTESHKVLFKKKRIGFLLPLIDLRPIKALLLYIYKIKYSKHYKDVCFNSDNVILLSLQYKNELSFLTGNLYLDKVLGIFNPIQLNDTIHINKTKELLYVGRINTSQKRVDLLMMIWSKLCIKYPDWRLNIVGGGDELESIKELSKKLKLENIAFWGFQDPQPFYNSASIFCMTSSFEGLPMTLLEAMQNGLVPIAFDSFLSASDVINDNLNGFLIEPFNVENYVTTVEKLMTNVNLREQCSVAAREKSKTFDLSMVGEEWVTVFKNLSIPV